ncbi:hypothetical protein ACFQY4_24530 [Catellatospora bangladeshensis]|uniref:hypothetical protein n=1 Tax=Catellatospora bangladeshensis TaxID=310355 RepID=UPI00360C2CE7
MRRLLAMLSAPVLLTSALVSVGLATPAHAACTSIPSTADPNVTLTVYRVGKSLNVNDKVMLSGFEAGWVESRMNNLPCGDKSSLGVFQQRWDYGWGTPEQIMDPVYASIQYFSRAITCDRNNPSYSPARSPSACSAPASPTDTTRSPEPPTACWRARGASSTSTPGRRPTSPVTAGTTSSCSTRAPWPTCTSPPPPAAPSRAPR